MSCPAGTANETSFTAWNDPNRFLRFFATILIGQDLSVSDKRGIATRTPRVAGPPARRRRGEPASG